VPEDDALTTELAAGQMLADAGMVDQAVEHFRAMSAKQPAEPRVYYALAFVLERAGREAEAVPMYAEAIRRRLTGESLARAYIGLGSSLRGLGRHDESVEVLSAGSRRFPEHVPLRAFLAIASAETGTPRAGVVELVEDLAAHHDFGPYSAAIRHAIADLRKRLQR
jgi:tetratricopeptide (TPR) repeat protein